MIISISLDIAEVALENARSRYEEMRNRAWRERHRLFQAHFIAADATKVRLYMFVCWVAPLYRIGI